MSKMDPRILDRCLRDIQSGEATLERCLAENPAHAEALEPHLRVASLIHKELAPTGPSETFRSLSSKRVINLTRARLKVTAPASRRRAVWMWRPAYRLAGILLALALLIGSVGAAYASSEALPGDGLYGVKRGLERAALAVSLSAEGDAELFLKHAGRRIAEIEELVRRGRGNDLGPALEGYERAVREGLEIASRRGAGLSDFGAALGNFEQALAGVIAEAPERAVPGLTRALENSRNRQNMVEQIRSGQPPGDAAPGQLKVTPDTSEGATELPPGQLKKEEARGRDLPPGQLKKTQTPVSNGSD